MIGQRRLADPIHKPIGTTSRRARNNGGSSFEQRNAGSIFLESRSVASLHMGDYRMGTLRDVEREI